MNYGKGFDDLADSIRSINEALSGPKRALEEQLKGFNIFATLETAIRPDLERLSGVSELVLKQQKLLRDLQEPFSTIATAIANLEKHYSLNEIISQQKRFITELQEPLRSLRVALSAQTGFILDIRLIQLPITLQNYPVGDTTPQHKEVLVKENKSQLDRYKQNTPKLEQPIFTSIQETQSLDIAESSLVEPPTVTNVISTTPLPGHPGIAIQISVLSRQDSSDDIKALADVLNIAINSGVLIVGNFYLCERNSRRFFYNMSLRKESVYFSITANHLITVLMKRHPNRGGITQKEAGKSKWKTYRNIKSNVNIFFGGEIIGYNSKEKMMFWNPGYHPNSSGR